MSSEIKWWRYVLAVLSFAALFILAPMILGIFFLIPSLFNSYYAPSFEWTDILSTAVGTYFALRSADIILKSSRPMFIMVLSIICAFYSVAVGTWNFALGSTEWFNMIAMFAGAVVSVLYAIENGKILIKSKDEHKNQETTIDV